jgi:hypothetical protein
MRRTILPVIASIAFLGAASQCNAGVLLTDTFNGENGGSGALNYTGFANWNVTSGSVDLIGNGFFDFFPGNGLYVDLDGSTGAAGQMTSIMNFAPGSYDLTFDLGGNARGDVNKTTDITLGSFSTSLNLSSASPYQLYSYSFTTTGGNLVFTDLPGGNQNIGNILDNVTVSTTPLPSTWTMLIAGFVGLFGFVAFGGKKRNAAAIGA